MKITISLDSDNLEEIHKGLDLLNMLKYRHPDFNVKPDKEKVNAFLDELHYEEGPIQLQYKPTKYDDGSPKPYKED